MIGPVIDQQQVAAIVQRSDAIMSTASTRSVPAWLREPKATPAEQAAVTPQLDKQGANILQEYAAQYAPQSNGKAQAWLRTRVNGVPVVPPNLRGKALQEYVDHTLMVKEENAAKTLVFISMDMPHSLLRRWFKEVADNKHLFETTVFVLRGWPNKAEGLPEMISTVNKLMPSFKKTANVEINPILFTDHQVNLVPVIIHQEPNQQWGVMVGDEYGFRGAVKRIDKGKGSPTKVRGEAWKIAEPNMIAVFQQKIRHFNWKAEEAKAKAHDWQNVRARLGDPLPDSLHGRNYTFNPSVIATRTIRLPNGKLLVRKGQEIDPLTMFPFPWSQSYIVLNPSQPWQVRQVQAWESMYPNVVIMASELPATWQGENAVANALNHPVYGIYPGLAQRLGINRVPALIRPDGDVLSITVPKEPLPGERR
ncbi:TrbC family F-type conjugative pilus assembly protein [Acidithiobacillus ferrianus]|uniref:TrbC family F-type conjugative pilus assembly protein n=1 Tax=Acidithiobacillus ferrianus TaxID=2678518 RepID=UPI0034E5BA4C